ncbi:uncharacterized protein VICG_00523 [Vittaforma corneae ATCC 50505]|uniref:Poly A polymerase head domain-containing protein n=1 Tax=Vittaforma corneae (strain ATCC 50505) TaxID=993615 RepID=L2GP62_VITCO|nr:uncharacterized protein VICG_00523 [Vittaforma corneae ATCC 50505]ELA42424.1 hypothetical protein VICG_00523 [Vittaforma corneae ATCC 50505]
MIKFCEQEEAICKLIRDHALSLNPAATPRLAGGFVRDKIMEVVCHDIDVALDNISGLLFATGLANKLVNHPTVYKILANPEKSKHLETAVLNLYGYSIDFVHLRSESYTQTRIPTIQKGTPEEDAFRRDITINSLFYNLITGEIEDFTGRGIHDIHNKVIDTPLDPRTTLLDDPLRILRIFRFKSKLGFKISKRIYDALEDRSLGLALEKKVSNERNGIEIMKMLQYENGEDGLIEIINNELVFSVFKPKTSIEIDKSKALEYSRNLRDVLNRLSDGPYLRKLTKKTVDSSLLKLYLVLQYFLNIKISHNQKDEFMNTIVMKDSLKTKKEIFSAVRSIEERIEQLLMNKTSDVVRIVVECKEYWLEVLTILLLKLNEQQYYDMICNIFDQNYHESYLETPLVNGDYLVSLNTDPKDFKHILFECFVLQIKNPDLLRDEIYSRYKAMHTSRVK